MITMLTLLLYLDLGTDIGIPWYVWLVYVTVILTQIAFIIGKEAGKVGHV